MGKTGNKSDQAEQLLPGHISTITPQKNNPDRYSIFIDDQFLVGVSDKVLLEFELEKGSVLTLEQYQKVQYAENRQSVRDYFLKLLGRRDHARGELLRKARQKKIDVQLAEKVLDELEEKGWLDSESFTRSFIHDKYHLNQWGPRKIVSALLQKGVDSSLAKKLTNDFFDSIDLSETFQQLINKNKYKWNQESHSSKKRKKVFDYLARKGYHTQQILKHLDRLMELLEQ